MPLPGYGHDRDRIHLGGGAELNQGGAIAPLPMLATALKP